MKSAMVSVDVGTVEVNVDLDMFDLYDLIEEVENSGYTIIDDREIRKLVELTDDDRNLMINLLDNAKIGSPEYDLRERLVNGLMDL